MTNTLLALHDPAVAERYYAAGLWRRDTLYSLLCEHMARRPQAFALRDRSRRLNWCDLREMVDAVCLLYTSPSPRDLSTSRMPSSA